MDRRHRLNARDPIGITIDFDRANIRQLCNRYVYNISELLKRFL